MNKVFLFLLFLSAAAAVWAAPVDDLARGKTVRANANEDTATRCVDGVRPAMGWSVAADAEAPWICVDLEKPRRIGSISLVWAEADHATEYTISLSTDGEAFTPIATETQGNGRVDAFGFSTTEARFVRLDLKKSASTQYHLRAFEVYAGADSTACAPLPPEKVPSLQGHLLREWTFDDGTDWREAQNRDVHPVGFQNNYTWGKKDIEVRPCQGVTGAGLMIDIRGISNGEMQFWTAPWPMVRHKYYRITFKAKADGLSNSAGVLVRRAINAWTRLVEGYSELPLTEEWQEFSFTGPGATDIDNDFGVMFFTAGIGKILLDDIRVEDFDENPFDVVIKTNTNPVVKGNLIPNSSLEIERNKFWAAMIPQNDPHLHYTDPGFVRREGGKFGKHCFALQPVVTPESGGLSASSITLPVASGVPYTLSLWVHGQGRAWSHVTLASNRVNGKGVSKAILVGVPKNGEWTRHTLTIDPIPDLCNSVTISFSKGGEGELFIDGLQLEVGDTATDYKPAHPYEIEATVEGGLPNIVPWGKPIPLRLSAYTALAETPAAEIPATLRVTAYPDTLIHEEKVTLSTGKTIPYALDPKQNGLFRIELIPQDPAAAPAFENIAARLPAPREDVDQESFFGAHISVRPYFLHYARKIGLKWARLHDCSNITKMKWGNPEPDVYRWHDESIDAIREAKLNILGMPDYFSAFAKRDLKDNAAAKTTFQKDDSATGENPIDVAAFTNWCTRVADHYKGRIDAWEVINEPYINGFYPGNAVQYAEIFEAGMKALRQGNPKAKVIGWCTELKTEGFIAQMPKENISDIDALSFHAYFSQAPGCGTMSMKADLDAVKEKMLTLRDPGEYWNTEGSWGGYGSLFYSFGGRNSTPKKHIDAAATDSRIWIEQKKAGIHKFFFYTLHQTDGLNYRGGYKNLIEYDRTPSIGGVATAVTAWFIDGLDPIPLTQIEGSVEGLFSGKGRTTYVVYDDTLYSGAQSLDLTLLPAEVLVADVMGTDLRKTGASRIRLASTPLYIHAQTADHAAILAACRAALVEE